MKKIFAIIVMLSCLVGTAVGQEYIYAYWSNATNTQTLGTTYTEYTGLVEGTSSSGWALSNTTTLTYSGTAKTFIIMVSNSFGGAAVTYDMALVKNDGTPSTMLHSQRTISTADKNRGNAVFHGIITVNNNDYIEVKMKASTAGTSMTKYSFNIVIKEISDNSASSYAEMYYPSSVIIGASGTTPFQVTGYDTVGSSISSDWTFSGNSLTYSGSSSVKFFISFSLSFTGFGKTENRDSEPKFNIYRNSTPTTIEAHRNSTENDIGNVGASGIIVVNQNDVISLYGANTNTSSGDFTIHSTSVTLHKLESTAAPYGAMSITSDTPVTPSTTAYSAITGFTDSQLNNWTFTNNSIGPTTGTLTAGKYLVQYSFSYKNTNLIAAEDYHFSVGKGSTTTPHDDLITERQLNNSSSIGSVYGSGIMDITSDTHILYPLIIATSSETAVTISKYNLTAVRIEQGTASDNSLPVELTYFTGKPLPGGVDVEWETASEIENLGFILERRIGQSDWEEIASYSDSPELRGQGSITYATRYNFKDIGLEPGTSVEYRLSDVDYYGKRIYHPEILVETGAIERVIESMGAYPNPFNPHTRIMYNLHQASHVNITVYDAAGREVDVLINGLQEPGQRSVQWNGMNSKGMNVSTGVYLYRVAAGKDSFTGKILFAK